VLIHLWLVGLVGFWNFESFVVRLGDYVEDSCEIIHAFRERIFQIKSGKSTIEKIVFLFRLPLVTFEAASSAFPFNVPAGFPAVEKMSRAVCIVSVLRW